MKHNLKITAIILLMFLVTQFIGLYVIDYYSQDGKVLPFGLGETHPETNSEYSWIFSQIVVAFIIAIVLLFLLSKFKIEIILKIWFFVVVTLALALALTTFIPEFNYKWQSVLIIALIFSFLKIFYRNFLIHNSTELLIYPGIAAVFVPLLNLWTIIILLILISIYDMWAVWHSGIMQKMAKYQIDTLKIFSGFFIPYVPKKTKEKIKFWKKTLTKSELIKKRIKVNVAILGGGDVVFPIIAAGVMLRISGFSSALFVIFGALAGLIYLLLISEKKKFYPAMPFITSGILIGMLIHWLVL